MCTCVCVRDCVFVSGPGLVRVTLTIRVSGPERFRDRTFGLLVREALELGTE